LLLHAVILAGALALVLALRLEDTRPLSAEAEYDNALRLFQRGYLEQTQREAELGFRRLQRSKPQWAVRFELLEAETMVRRGLSSDALSLLKSYRADDQHPEENIRELVIEANALLRQLPLANKRLDEAAALCHAAEYGACVNVLRVRAIAASRQGDFETARQRFLDSLAFARRHGDRWSEIGALTNAGWASMKLGRMEEAVDWLSTARHAAVQAGSEYWAQLAEGNLGWAYYQLGDDDKALELFLDAEKTAAKIGGLRDELLWTSDEGGVHRDQGDNAGAESSYKRALTLSRTTGNADGEVHALEDLALLGVVTGKLDQADAYVRQAVAIEGADGGQLSPYLMLTQGMLAAARRQDQQAAILFEGIEKDAANPLPVRIEARLDLARQLEREGRNAEAESGYRATLEEFEQARAQLHDVDSRLPFAVNGDRIYDGYIHFLVQQGRGDAALALADQSRARALAESLGEDAGEAQGRAHGKNQVQAQADAQGQSGPEPGARPSAGPDPRQVARKAGATLLFYWMGEEQSYLWVITGDKVSLFPLAADAEIVTRASRYSKALLDIDDPLETHNEDGQALYRLLVAPAAGMIPNDRPAMILADGELNRLNFETLLAPATASGAEQTESQKPMHYWIEDQTLLSAPSMAMLAAARQPDGAARSLLLLGDPESPSAEFPRLPLFGYEMKTVGKHFEAANVTALAGRQATPAAYLSSNPSRYAYIHFVSHAVASKKDPLDSAIILSDPREETAASVPQASDGLRGGSKTVSGDDSKDGFRLSARAILQHRVDARLVTISSCSGSGTRAYAGEGLVGLSWAFLHAGAQNVIGALWEASDDSTPRLMDALYPRLADKQTPAVALRSAKLAMLHAGGRFRSPFYWAPFQLTAR
jgi:CHAT domain-containing protein